MATDAGAAPEKEWTVSARLLTSGPVPGAPTLPMVVDTGQDRPAGGVFLPTDKIPFNYNFTFQSSLASRSFWPSSDSKACVSLRGTGGSDPTYFGKEVRIEMWDAYGTDTKIGPTVRYSLNGNAYGYCWSGTYPYHEHYFRLLKDWGPGITVWGSGWVSPT
ncbi:hypothetical protein [Actinokineospora enzanensis]|uniref:hypothetical protein n=1 Tax=Actinokineospora enzanensis TaxID=155975 RepID=UPI0012EB6462|nr:hypothetical protein [Actinokineospora enzanensis]